MPANRLTSCSVGGRRYSQPLALLYWLLAGGEQARLASTPVPRSGSQSLRPISLQTGQGRPPMSTYLFENRNAISNKCLYTFTRYLLFPFVEIFLGERKDKKMYLLLSLVKIFLRERIVQKVKKTFMRTQLLLCS